MSKPSHQQPKKIRTLKKRDDDEWFEALERQRKAPRQKLNPKKISQYTEEELEDLASDFLKGQQDID